MALISGNNVFNMTQGVLGLFGKTNKSKSTGDEDEFDGAPIGEFESKLSDEELLTLSKLWTDEYDNYAKDIKEQQKANVNYWIGKQHNEVQQTGTKRPLVDNLIFEAVETFLPIATRANPEPNVTTVEGQNDDFTKTVRDVLVYQADRQGLRMKLKSITRNWTLYLIGAGKIVWDAQEGDMDTKVVLPSHLVLDPNAEIGVDGQYYGDRLGEKKKATAKKLSRMFPKMATKIKEKCNGAMGTKLAYVEWWTPLDYFFVLDQDVVLGKFKNPHWNYDGEVEVEDPETHEKTKEEVKGTNHFSHPRIPYIMLTIFNIGRRPHDETSLIYQNIPLQDTINKRYQQIDRNVDGQNNGIVLSGKSFTKEQAAEAAIQLSRGNPLWVPDGAIGDSYKRDNPPSLASDIFHHLEDAREELRNIFGTSGSAPQGVDKQDSVRGKILINQLDASRIGGGVTEYIEAIAGTFYNWYVQMMYVYYTEERQVPILGTQMAGEFAKIRNTDFQTPVYVKVKDGSLVPKDPLTARNEAMDLWSAQAIDPITLFTRLDFPNPLKSAQDLLTWQLIQQGKLPPQTMFPDMQQAQPAPVQEGTGIVSNAEDNASGGAPPAPDMSQQLLGAVPLR